jgi:hypothetical protein
MRRIECEKRMTATNDKQETEEPDPSEQEIQDRGGSRCGRDRRQNAGAHEGIDRRTGRERRRGFDRRTGIERRRSSNDRRSDRFRRDGDLIERRDAFRHRLKGK